MGNVVINAKTMQELTSFIRTPSHAIGLVTVNGSGKRSVSEWLASQILKIPISKLASYPYLLILSSHDDKTSIDEIRSIQKFLKLKTPFDNHLIRRVVIIEHADEMTREAQNALLKQLEEPPDDTLFILTLDNTHSILPTVLSRLTVSSIHKPSKDQIVNHFNDTGYEKADIDKAFSITGGLIGLMSSLLGEDETEKTVTTINDIKLMLKMDRLDRLLLIDKLSMKRDDLKQYIVILIQIAQGTITQVASKNDDLSLLRWKKVLSLSYDAKVALQKNAQPKLVLLDLLINL